MLKKTLILSVGCVIGFVLASCAAEQGRQVRLPQSDESVLPWNGLREGEAQGQFGAFQQR